MKSQVLKIVKIGSSILSDRAVLQGFLKDFSSLTGLKVLVHGGGQHATELAEQLNVKVRMVDGRRITCEDTLEIITMSYAGRINKDIVAQLQGMDCNAMGFTGADGNLIEAIKRPPSPIDFGFVGDVIAVNRVLLNQLLGLEITPVFCALTHDSNGTLLNTNADTIASELALNLASSYKTELYYCFDQPGVMESLDDPDSLISEIDPESFEKMKKKKQVSDGMIPKLDNCMHALKHNVDKIFIGNHNLLKPEFETFTTIHKG
ncbi:MAG: acetylglutamate kinase [Flavobacteriaceae bacterium]|nr:acetylglutamate kinase [Flavobacteriaceae bacterium]